MEVIIIRMLVATPMSGEEVYQEGWDIVTEEKVRKAIDSGFKYLWLKYLTFAIFTKTYGHMSTLLPGPLPRSEEP